MTAAIATEHVDEIVRDFAAALIYTTNRERRTAMSSPLYDLPGRSSLGFAVVHEVAPGLVERLERVVPAEEIGRRMRAPLVRPYYLQLFILFEGYLMGREQRLLDGRDVPGDDAERTARVADWFARAAGAYRIDGSAAPAEGNPTQRILDDAEVERWTGGTPLREDVAARAQRALGAIELYALTVHGEQRDGNFDHGPYDGPGGEVVQFHEINDLSNDFLPWVLPEDRLPVDAVGVVRAYPAGAGTLYDMFGTSSGTSSSFDLRAVLARDDAGLRAIDVDELEALGAAAQAATGRLYRRIAGWEPAYKTEYGRPLFLNHLVPFARLAGDPEVERWLVAAGADAGAEELALQTPGEGRSVWTLFGAKSDDMFRSVG